MSGRRAARFSTENHWRSSMYGYKPPSGRRHPGSRLRSGGWCRQTRNARDTCPRYRPIRGSFRNSARWCNVQRKWQSQYLLYILSNRRRYRRHCCSAHDKTTPRRRRHSRRNTLPRRWLRPRRNASGKLIHRLTDPDRGLGTSWSRAGEFPRRPQPCFRFPSSGAGWAQVHRP